MFRRSINSEEMPPAFGPGAGEGLEMEDLEKFLARMFVIIIAIAVVCWTVHLGLFALANA